MLKMRITFLQFVLAGSVSLLAIFWMRAALFYAALICTILICSWLLGLMMYLQFGQVPAAVDVDGLSSVCDNKYSMLYSTVVRLFLLLLLIL